MKRSDKRQPGAEKKRQRRRQDTVQVEGIHRSQTQIRKVQKRCAKRDQKGQTGNKQVVEKKAQNQKQSSIGEDSFQTSVHSRGRRYRRRSAC